MLRLRRHQILNLNTFELVSSFFFLICYRYNFFIFLIRVREPDAVIVSEDDALPGVADASVVASSQVL